MFLIFPNLGKGFLGKSIVYLEAFIDEDGIVKKCIFIKVIGGKLDEKVFRVIKQTKF